MRTRWLTSTAAAGLVVAGTPAARAQPAPDPIPPTLSADALGPAHPAEAAWSAAPAMANPCPTAPAAGDDKPAPFTPFMIGDFVGPVANLFTNFKIAESESPRPVDRVFFKYNFYDDINPTRWKDPTEPVHNVKLDLYTIGMEKTFFDGIMSLGLRLPFYTMDAQAKDIRLGPDPVTGAVGPIPGGPGFDESYFGNLIAIAKVLVWDDRETGSALSAGAVLSFPTASSVKLDPGLSAMMYVQPFSGFILTNGDAFVQGFTSMILPVVRPESIITFVDIGVGYYVYKDNSGARFISAIAPTFEIHYTAPLRQPNPVASLGVIDNLQIHNTIDLTFGSTFELAHRATSGVGVAVPVTGPRPFDVEALVQLNYMF